MLLKAAAGTALGMILFATILSTYTWDVQETQTYLIYEPYTYEDTLIRSSQTRPFPWINEVTQAQYTVRNTDSKEGEFTLNFAFDNGAEIKTTTKTVGILAGEEKAVSANSPLPGKSTPTLNVIAPKKAIPQQRTITKQVHIWDYWFLFH